MPNSLQKTIAANKVENNTPDESQKKGWQIWLALCVLGASYGDHYLLH